MLRPLLALLALMVVGCAQGAEPAPAQAVRVETVAQAHDAPTSTFEGVAAYGRQSVLSFRFPGYVERFGAHPTEGRALAPGDRVKAGTLLASLRASDLRNQLAEANGMGAEVGAGQAKAKADYDQARALFDGGAISKAELNAAHARYLSTSGATSAAHARVSSAKLALQDATLTAPFDGVVLARTVDEGGLVAAGAPVLSVGDDDTLRVVVPVPREALSGTAVGATVTVRREGATNTILSGTVSKLTAPASGLPFFDVEVVVANEDHALSPGDTLRVVFTKARAERPQVTVPVRALVRGAAEGELAVFTVDEANGVTRAHRRPLRLANVVQDRVEVLSGLAVGERVVVQGASFLAERERVLVLP